MVLDTDLTPGGAPELLPDDSGGEAAEPSLRDELEAAFEAEPTDEQRERPDPGDTRPRDPLGRFAPGKGPGGPQDAAKPPLGTQAPPGRAQAPGTPAAPEALKAPASWTPNAREKWQAVPPEVQAEIHRREGEMGRVLQETAGVRQFADAFERVVRPYEMFIRQEGSSPLAAVDHLMRSAAELRVGTAGSKANLVAEIIKTHGVDVGMLDLLLANSPEIAALQAQAQGHQAPQQFRDPRFDQFLAAQQQHLQQQAAWEDQEMRQGLDAFASQHEFYADVAGVMADLVEVRARQGQPIDMEKIYAQACALHDDVSTILNQRQPAAPAGNGARSQAVLRAKRAAVSVRGDATPHGAMPADDSIRATLEAAFDQSGRI